MKSLFPHPIGTLRELGTRKEWLFEAACLLICAAVVILALIVL